MSSIVEIRNKIMSDDSFLIKQLDEIALYYNLKHTIRWAHERGNEDISESVAEHIYGMHILIDYFVPIIDNDSRLDLNTLHSYASWHDMAETIVSDMPTSTKTEEHKQAEKKAEEDLLQTSPEHLQPLLKRVFEEYDEQQTKEAKLAKALDKIEPMFHMYFLVKQGYDESAFDLGWSAEAYRSHRKPYIEPFEILLRFDDVLYEHTKHLHPN